MSRNPILCLLTFFLAAGLPAALPAGKAPAAPKGRAAPVDASVPAPQNRPRFFELHESFLARDKAGPIGVVFLGDSITYGWSKVPRVWEHYFGQYQPANFGIGSEQTQHVLWRIEHGELDGISPKLVVLLIGTNNSATNTAAEILAAQTKIVRLIRAKLPQTKVLVLAIFPRGPRHPDKHGVMRDDGVTRMRVIDAVNAGLPALDDGRDVRVLNINSVFLEPDGKIPSDIMPDQLHPNEKGYRLWAEAMMPLFEEMMR